MTELAQKKCQACNPNAPHVTPDEIEQLKPKIPNWEMIEVDGQKRLQRRFEFPNFKAALDFTNRVGEEAEKEDHHPALLTEYGSVTVTWWTHAIGGLHENDFIMAAKSDRVAESL